MARPVILLLPGRIVEPEAGKGKVLVQGGEASVAGIGVAVEADVALLGGGPIVWGFNHRRGFRCRLGLDWPGCRGKARGAAVASDDKSDREQRQDCGEGTNHVPLGLVMLQMQSSGFPVLDSNTM
jgi:hypothetical protein